MTESNCNLIQNGDKVILKKGNNIQTAQIQKSKKANIDKQWFQLTGAIGHPYGTTFEPKGNTIYPVKDETDIHDLTETEAGKDNRNIVDTSDSQKVSREEIEEMRRKGEKGEDVIRHLIENSATFKDKTEYSKAKYIKKKAKKHVSRFTIVRPCTRLIAEMYFNKGPARINNLRMDSLAQILTYGDVKAHNRQLVVESCNGLLLAATMERMGGHGTILQLHSEQDPPRQAIEGYNFTPEHHQMLQNLPLRLLSTVCRLGIPESTEKETSKKPSLEKSTEGAATEVSKQEIKNGGEDNSLPLQGTSTEAEDEGSNNVNQDSMQVDLPTEASQGEMDAEDTTTSPVEGESEEERDTDQGPTTKAKKPRLDEAAKVAVKAEQERRKHQRQIQIETAKQTLKEGRFDSLLVATRVHPTPIVLRLLDFLSDSRPVAIFCPYQEPLMDCYQRLRDSGHVVHLRLTETWFRNYQVLPNRTHPEINMSTNGGYLLTFIKVSNLSAVPSTG